MSTSDTGEMLDFRCRSTLKGLVKQLEKVGAYFGGAPLKLCYEASYVGFSLQRAEYPQTRWKSGQDRSH